MPHIHEKIDFTAEVFIVHDGRVLLRKHDKYDRWLSVGGHIELDEDPTEAAVREAKEEVGLTITLIGTAIEFEGDTQGYRELIPPPYMNIHPVSPTHQHVSLVYFATTASDVVVEEHEKSKGYAWYTKEEVEAHPDLSPSIRFYALRALEAAR